MRAALVTLLLLATVLIQGDDHFEYGSVEELKGVKLVYVDTGNDIDLRNVMKRVLEETKMLKVVEKPDDAKHWVIFRWWGDDPYRCRTIVVTNGTTSNPRLLFTQRGREAELDDLAADAAKALSKAYRRVNGLQ
jgi:hypothetical protein